MVFQSSVKEEVVRDRAEEEVKSVGTEKRSDEQGHTLTADVIAWVSRNWLHGRVERCRIGKCRCVVGRVEGGDGGRLDGIGEEVGVSLVECVFIAQFEDDIHLGED